MQNSTRNVSNPTAASTCTCLVVASNSFGSITSSVANLMVAGRPTMTNTFTGPALRFTFTGETGVTYRVESSPTVDFTASTTVTNLSPALDGMIAITNAPTPGAKTFFRLRLLSP